MITAIAHDLVGRTSQAIVRVKVDNDDPTVEITSPASGIYVKSGADVPINFIAGDPTTGIKCVEVRVDGSKKATIYAASGTYNWTAPASGKHTISVRAWDHESHFTDRSITINVDDAAPVAVISSPPDDKWFKSGTPVTINFSGTDTGSGIDRLELSIDGGLVKTVSGGTGTFVWTTPSSSQSSVVSVLACDKVGWSASASIQINTDADPPLIANPPRVAGSNNGYTSAPVIEWSWQSSDGESGLQDYRVYVEENGVVIADWVTVATAGYSHPAHDGKTYRCAVKARDMVGNEAQSPFGTVVADHSVAAVGFPSYPLHLDGDKIKLAWEPVNDLSGILRYEVALTESAAAPAPSQIREVTAPGQDGRWVCLFDEIDPEKAYYAWVRGVDRLGNLGPWRYTGPFPAFVVEGPGNETMTRELNQVFGLERRSPIAGDELRFRVCYRRSGGSSYVTSGEMQVGAITMTFPGEGVWEWWCEVAEFADGALIPDSIQITPVRTLTVDTSPPVAFEINVTPAGWTADTRPILDFATTDSISGVDHYELSVDGSVFTIINSPYRLSLQSDGVHTVKVRAVDRVGLDYTATALVYLDTTPPQAFDVAVEPKPNEAGWIQANQLSLAFATGDGSGSGIKKYMLAIDGGPWQQVVSPCLTPFLSGGTHTIAIRAEDHVGHYTDATAIVRLDTTPPTNLNVLVTPATWTSNTRPTITFAAEDGLSGIDRYELAIDDGEYQVAVSPYLPAGLTDGVHTIRVRAIDRVGLTTETTATAYIDTTPPAAFDVIAIPAGWAADPQPVLIFAAIDQTSGIDRYELSVDNSAYQAVTSPHTLTPLVDGVHNIRIKAVNRAGLATEASTTVSIDTTPPKELSIYVDPDGWTTNPQPIVSFSAIDASSGLAHYELAVDDGVFQTVTSPYQLPTLSDGTHRVTVRAYDRVGLMTESDHEVFIDTTPPSAFSIETDSPGWSSNPRPTLTFGTTDSNGSGIDHYEISIDGGGFQPCSSPYTVPPLSDGVHTIVVRAIDGVSLYTEASISVSIDTLPPAAPEGFSHSHAGDRIGFTWQTTDEVYGYAGKCIFPDGSEISLDVTPGSGGCGSIEVDTAGIGANQPLRLLVHSVDRAGNRSQAAEYVVYTAASPGSPTGIEQGFSETMGRFLTGVVSGGQAARQFLEVSAHDDFLDPFQIALDESGRFIQTGLAPHAVYYYRVVALNGQTALNGIPTADASDRAVGAVFACTTSNVPPTAPLALEPEGYAGCDVAQFRYDRAVDPDGDILSYRVYLGQGTTPIDFTELPQERVEGLAHGQEYTWYVVADDGYGGSTASAKVRFAVDAVPPVLIVEKPGGIFVSQRNVAVSATDNAAGDSGVACLVYQELAGGQWGPEIEIGGGTIPLKEGENHLLITARDLAGNASSIRLDLRTDLTAPCLSNATINLPQGNGMYLAGTSLIPVSFTATDSYSGVRRLRYWWGQTPGGETGEGILVPLRANLQDYAYELAVDALPGQAFYLVISLEDQAGNWTDPQYLGPIYIDSTPPEILNFTLSGLSVFGSARYLTDPSRLTATLEATDAETGIAACKYAMISSPGNTPITPWGDWDTIRQAALTVGGRYRVEARLINGAGLQTFLSSDEFLFDDTPPSDLRLTGPSSAIAAGEVAVFDAQAKEDASGIVEYRFAIGLTAGGREITAQVAGNVDGWLIRRSSREREEFRVRLPEAADGQYYTTLDVVNAAGLSAILSGDSFSMVNVQDRVVVGDQGPYSMFTDRLTGWWRYAGIGPVTCYRFRVCGPAGEAVTDWSYTEQTAATLTGLALQPGNRYRFEVQAVLPGDEYSASGFSPGVVIDTSAPSIDELSVPVCSTSWGLAFSWAGDDAESGIDRVEAALGSDYGGTDVTGGWVVVAEHSCRLNRRLDGSGLELATGTRYYLRLRLTNGAGLTREAAASVLIDDTPPPAPVVFDQGAFINVSPSQPLDCHWIWSPADPESGTIRYRWTLLTSKDDLLTAEWHDDDGSGRISLNLPREHGKIYYFVVEAENGVGLTSLGWSDGIMADATAPFIPCVRLLNALDLGNPEAQELNYITDNADLGLLIESSDPESDIKEYLYTWGPRAEVDLAARVSSATQGICLTDPEIPEGEITVFLGECLNGADELSSPGYSTGVLLDRGAPRITNVKGWSFGSTLHFDWDVINSSSPLAYFEVALVPESTIGADPAMWSWRNIGTDPVYTHDGQSLVEGPYYLVVRGVNRAGSVSRRQMNEWGFSPRVIVDATPPVITGLACPAYCAAEFTATIQAEDIGAGLFGYQYALGTRYNLFEFTGGWVDLPGQTGSIGVTIPTASIPNGTEIYLCVRAMDKVGQWSMAKVSEAIIVDRTAPVIQVLACRDYATSHTMLDGIAIAAADPESPVTHYSLALVRQVGDVPGDSEWADYACAEFAGQLPNLVLEENGVYYLAGRVRNAAGLWSAIAYSETILVDTLAPTDMTIVVEPAGWTNDPRPVVTFSAVDAASGIDRYELALDDGAYQPVASPYRLPIVPDGEHSVHVKAVDKAGLETTAVAKIYIDTTPPLPFSVSASPAGWSRNPRPILTFATSDTTSGVEGYTISIDGGAEQAAASPYTLPVLSDGEHVIAITAVDKAGCTNTASVMVYVDTTPPQAFTVTVDPEGWSRNAQPTLTFATSDATSGIDHYELAIDDAPFQTVTSPVQLPAQTDGKHTILVRAVDKAGGSYVATAEIFVDTTPPRPFDVTADPAGWTSETRPTISFDAVDEASGLDRYEVSIDGGLPQTASSPYRLPVLADGRHLIQVTAIDRVGLCTTAEEFVYIDTEPPLAFTIEAPAGWINDVRPILRFAASDETSGIDRYEISIDGAPFAVAASPYQLPPQSDGEHTVVVRAIDLAGLARTAEATVRINRTKPFLTFAQAGETIVLNQAPAQIEFFLSEAAEVQFTLTAADGGTRQFSFAGAPGTNFITFAETKAQTYLLKAVPVDVAGNIGDEATQPIRVNAPPLISIPGTIETTPGKPITLQASVTDPDGEPAHYEWDPGDGGNPLSGPSPVYRWKAIGDYVLTLTVADNDGGIGTATAIVKVRNTTRGILYMDETWSGSHHIYGDVIVPPEITLTILPGTMVLADRLPGDQAGFDHALIIQGSLTINGGEQGVTFVSAGGQSGRWQGIFVEGTAVVEHVTVTHAVRGLTVVGTAAVKVMYCIFRDNEVGLHVFGATPTIANSTFQDNTLYGIKEDEGGRPVVIDCLFAGTIMDYYHTDMTVITIEQLNALPGNSGNTHQ